MSKQSRHLIILIGIQLIDFHFQIKKALIALNNKLAFSVWTTNP